MAITTKDIEPKAETPTLRVVYRLADGSLGPKNTRGETCDSLPSDTRGLETAKAHARWIVDGTLWSSEALVQERTFKGKWRTVYAYEDI